MMLAVMIGSSSSARGNDFSHCGLVAAQSRVERLFLLPCFIGTIIGLTGEALIASVRTCVLCRFLKLLDERDVGREEFELV